MTRARIGLAALVLAGCSAAASGPRAITELGTLEAWAQAGSPLPAGVIMGKVARLDGNGFKPASGVTVRLRGLTARTDAAGRYAFSHVPAGDVAVSLSEPGHYPVEALCRSSAVMGVPRVHLALVPTTALAGQPADVAVIAGVVSDPRGAALSEGTVHLVDSASQDGQGSNMNVKADGDGYYVALLVGLARGPLLQGQASITAFGTTPGGVRVESRSVTGLVLGPQPTYAVAAATDAFLPPTGLRLVGSDASRLTFEATRLPTRRDELTVRLDSSQGVWEVPPTTVDGTTVIVDRPPGCCPASTRVRFATFGVSSPLGGAAEMVMP